MSRQYVQEKIRQLLDALDAMPQDDFEQFNSDMRNINLSSRAKHLFESLLNRYEDDGK